MNDNDQRTNIAERLPIIEDWSSKRCASNNVRAPENGRTSELTLRRQIDNWVNEGGANDQ